VDTRRYLNLDDAAHAYAFRWSASDELDPSATGGYEPYRSLPEAIEHLDLRLFDDEPSFVRSFPPDTWPPARPALR
jgi:hypothetical protein